MAEEWGDFSHHRAIDVEAYFDAGYDTIAWKISEADAFEDSTWAAAWRIAARRRKRFIGYHFDRARFDGAAQFDWFIGRWLAVAGQLRPGLDIPCHDVEDTQYPTGARASMLRFTSRAATRGYPTGIIYSGTWYASPNGVRLDDLPSVGWRHGWLSDYTAGQADTAIELPAGWPRAWVTARQYTDRKPWPNQPDGVDFNRTLTAWPGGDVALTPDEIDAIASAVWTKAVPNRASSGALVSPAQAYPAGHYLATTASRANDTLKAVSAQADDEARIVAAVQEAVAPLLDDEAKLAALVEQVVPGGSAADVATVTAAVRAVLSDVRLSAPEPPA